VSHGALLTTADGARIELRPNTSVSFVAGAKGTEVVLKQGTVLVQRLQDAGQAPKSPRRHGSGQAAVMVEGLLARSVDKGSGLFEVARQEKRVDVTAGRGAVEISGLVNGSVTVPAGKRATLEARPMTTGQEEPPPTGAGSISYAGIPAWGWFLIAMGGAGAIIGIILAVTGEESPSSP
jgi:ferric-dicitrate binding protein FerR (iron transport regulator)